MAQGLAVTWDNPDIGLYKNGTQTSSASLLPDTEYEVRATIYNGSNEGFAVNMPVDFSFLSFGIGTVKTPIGTTHVDLPVNGAPGHPATAVMKWRTPATPGHYCLQVQLNWADDRNPHNNLGQENTNVGIFHSPAVFEFPVGNDTSALEHITLKADSYSLLTRIDCRDVTNGRVVLVDHTADHKLTGKELCDALAEQHKKERFPVPDGWTVEIDPEQFDLDSHKQQIVKVTITPPDSFTVGTQAFNINAYNAPGQLIGGVTLYVQR